MIAIQHQIRNVDVQFIVECEVFESAVRARHAALVEGTDITEDGRAAA
jgi:aspartate kinase